MLKLNHLTGFGSGVAAAAGDSYVFDGTGDYLSVPDHADWDFPQGDFTIDFWMYTSDDVGEHKVYSQYADVDGPANNYNLTWENTGDWVWRIEDNSTQQVRVSSTAGTITLNEWFHFALVRNGDAYLMFLNGVDVTSGGTPDDYDAVGLAGTVYIGQEGNSSNYHEGYLDEFRISNTARWTSGFTPPTAQYTSDANTVLLIHCGEAIASGTTGSGATFVDSGNTGHTVTENGDAIRAAEFGKFSTI